MLQMSLVLTKSKYLSGLQCLKYLWHLFNAKDQIPALDEDKQAIFDQGHYVGNLAKTLFPDGIEVPFSKSGAVKETLKTLKKRLPVFEASLMHGNCFARADILVPVGDDAWDLIEVKSSTSVKDENYFDIGFQYYVYSNSGLNIDKCFIMHLNNEYVRKGALDLAKLFRKVDVTAQAKSTYAGVVEDNVKKMMKIISAGKPPECDIGEHCNTPYDCPLMDKCWSFLPERNVFFLYRGNKLPFELVKKGILRLKDIPQGEYALNDSQKIQIDCEKTNKPHFNKKKIEQFLSSIKYPAYYMDFETIMPAIPMFDGTKPYSQVPFQFSVHIVEKAGTRPKHYSFLADGVADPRPEFMARLKKVMGTKGSVIAFYASFEKSRLEECAGAYPEYAKWVASINDRVVDLLIPFRAFAYYHPKQNGSCSLKKVLPVLTGKSYDDMEIGDGGIASREYFRVTYTDDNADKAKVRRDLEAYCGLDTLGMVEIVEKLRECVE